MPVTVHALSSFMIFPASNAHACIVPVAPVLAVQREREGTGSLRRRSIVTVNRGGVIGLQPRILFRFSQTKYQLRKRQGVPYRSRHGYAAGVPTVLVTTGHQIDGATVRQRACPATKPRTCRPAVVRPELFAEDCCREDFSIARRPERSVKTAETRHLTRIAAPLMAEAEGTYQTQCRLARTFTGQSA